MCHIQIPVVIYHFQIPLPFCCTVSAFVVLGELSLSMTFCLAALHSIAILIRTEPANV